MFFISRPYFKTNYLHLTAGFKQDLSAVLSFIIYICIDGKATIVNDDGEVNMRKGETVLISADTRAVEIRTTAAKFLVVDV